MARSRVELHAIEAGNHGNKNSEEEPSHLLRGANENSLAECTLFGIAKYDGRSREHNCFAEKWRTLDENRAENDREKENVRQSRDVDLASSGFFFTTGAR
jgi:hypothetical protein